jgi:hypothetical protein
VAGPVLAELLKQKKVVRTKVLKSSGNGETWYDAWRLATNDEFLAAKIGEMGLIPDEPNGRVSEKPIVGRALAEDEDDTDCLDEVAVAGGSSEADEAVRKHVVACRSGS